MIDLSDLIRVNMQVKDTVLVREGDLLICVRNGSKALVGKTALITDLPEEMAFGAFMAIFRSIANPYLLYFINSPLFRRTIDDVNTTTINQITQGNLKATAVSLPPLAEQHRIVAKVEKLMALCDQLEEEQDDGASAHARLVEALLSTLTQSTDAADLTANWQRLAGHIDTLFTTESSIDAVKQSILQLAVMGKLVPQDPNDEPAVELLKTVPPTKKPLPAVESEELLFEVPSNWQWIRLGAVFPGGSGTTPSRARHDYFDGGTENWVKTTDLNNGIVTSCEELITLSAVRECNLTHFPARTVCVAMYGGRGTIGKSGILGFSSTINQSVFALPPVKQIDSTFIHYYLKSIRGVWMQFAAGLRIAANINGKIIKNMVFPVPPLAEQRRIVAKVDELMTICDQLKADLAIASKRQAVLAETLIESALEAA